MQHTEPAQERPILQTLLGRHAAVRREDMSQHEHIQLSLVVAHKDSRACCVQPVLFIVYLHPDAREQQHRVLERLRRRPLSQAAIAHHVETCRRDRAVYCAYDESDEGGH